MHGLRGAATNTHNPMDYNGSMLTVAELPEYIRGAERLLSGAERNELAALEDLLVQIWQNH